MENLEYKKDCVYRSLIVRRFKELVSVLEKLTMTRRDWICKTVDSGWLVEFESFVDDKLFSEIGEENDSLKG